MADDTLPTEQEIRQLPLWARVAFAARCARRAIPLFTLNWPAAPLDFTQAIRLATEEVERFATSGTSGYFSQTSEAFAAYNAAVNVAARTAAAAVFDAGRAASVAAAGSDAITFTYRTAASAANAGVRVALIRADFRRLETEAKRNKWTDKNPVPPSVFGPLDEAVPAPVDAGDPLEADEHVTLVLRAFAEPGVSASVLAEHLVVMYKALNEYTLAKYGQHLTRGHFRRLVCKHAGVLV